MQDCALFELDKPLELRFDVETPQRELRGFPEIDSCSDLFRLRRRSCSARKAFYSPSPVALLLQPLLNQTKPFVENAYDVLRQNLDVTLLLLYE
jgi:hypothetical protein